MFTVLVRVPVGVLADGTPYFAPLGAVVVEGSQVICHLCGHALRSVTAHLRRHGWTKQAYCDAFGLERGQSLEGPETRKLRAAAFTSRLVFDPAVRAGSAAGRQRARAGALARMRPPRPPGGPIPSSAAGRPGRRRGHGLGCPAAPRLSWRRSRPGWPSGTATRTSARSCWPGRPRGTAWRPSAGPPGCTRLAVPAPGRHRPAGRGGVPELRSARLDARWRPALARLGFTDVPSYLRDRHAGSTGRPAIAAETGLSHSACRPRCTARAGLGGAHGQTARRARARRPGGRQPRLRHIPTYVGQRRAAGEWRAMSAEPGSQSRGCGGRRGAEPRGAAGLPGRTASVSRVSRQDHEEARPCS